MKNRAVNWSIPNATMLLKQVWHTSCAFMDTAKSCLRFSKCPLNLQFCQSLSWPRLLLPLDYLPLCPMTLLTGFFTSPSHWQNPYLILQWVGELNWKEMLLFPSAHHMKLFAHFSPLTGSLCDHTKRREEWRKHVRKGGGQPHFRSYTKLLWNFSFKNTTLLYIMHMCVCGCSKRTAHSLHCSGIWYRILEMLGHLDSWINHREPPYF